MTDYTLQPKKATAWCQAKRLPAIPVATQRELVRIAAAVYQAIIDGDDSPPPEVRVYYQSLKFIASVSGAPRRARLVRHRGGRGIGTAQDPVLWRSTIARWST